MIVYSLTEWRAEAGPQGPEAPRSYLQKSENVYSACALLLLLLANLFILYWFQYKFDQK